MIFKIHKHLTKKGRNIASLNSHFHLMLLKYISYPDVRVGILVWPNGLLLQAELWKRDLNAVEKKRTHAWRSSKKTFQLFAISREFLSKKIVLFDIFCEVLNFFVQKQKASFQQIFQRTRVTP